MLGARPAGGPASSLSSVHKGRDAASERDSAGNDGCAPVSEKLQKLHGDRQYLSCTSQHGVTQRRGATGHDPVLARAAVLPAYPGWGSAEAGLSRGDTPRGPRRGSLLLCSRFPRRVPSGVELDVAPPFPEPDPPTPSVHLSSAASSFPGSPGKRVTAVDRLQPPVPRTGRRGGCGRLLSTALSPCVRGRSGTDICCRRALDQHLPPRGGFRAAFPGALPDGAGRSRVHWAGGGVRGRRGHWGGSRRGHCLARAPRRQAAHASPHGSCARAPPSSSERGN